jgi:hypothetical protein
VAFAAGPVSFQRFTITGSIPSDVTDRFVEAVAGKAFGQSPAQTDDTQIGWIGPGHLFETTIAAERIAFGRFAHLAMRIDSLRVPPNVLRSYIRMEEEVAQEAGGREFLNRAEKRKAREAALVRAQKEARGGGFRRMNSYPVLIDLEGGTVYLGNLGAKAGEKLMQLFSDTFGCALEPVDVDRIALRSIGSLKDGRVLEQLAPFHLAAPPNDFGEEAADFARGNLAFLGKEFLTWLWYHVDADEGPLRIQTGDELTVAIDKTLRLKCDFELTGTDVIAADNPTSLPEARAALRIGKQPTRMGLIVGGPLGEFRFTLDGPRMTVTGLALPDGEDEPDARARIERRFELVVDLAEVLDALLELYLYRRTAKGWSGVLRKMSHWAAGQPAETLLRLTTA